MEHLVECKDIVKTYRGRGIGGAKRGFKALDGISLQIDRNESYGLVGESGCGKTTFARALLYLDPPTSGSISFDGVRLETLGRREFRKFRKRIQIVFQDPNSALNPKMSIHASLSEGLINRGIGENRTGETRQGSSRPRGNKLRLQEPVSPRILRRAETAHRDSSRSLDGT